MLYPDIIFLSIFPYKPHAQFFVISPIMFLLLYSIEPHKPPGFPDSPFLIPHIFALNIVPLLEDSNSPVSISLIPCPKAQYLLSFVINVTVPIP